jgi:hypothetical protein
MRIISWTHPRGSGTVQFAMLYSAPCCTGTTVTFRPFHVNQAQTRAGVPRLHVTESNICFIQGWKCCHSAFWRRRKSYDGCQNVHIECKGGQKFLNRMSQGQTLTANFLLGGGRVWAELSLRLFMVGQIVKEPVISKFLLYVTYF